MTFSASSWVGLIVWFSLTFGSGLVPYMWLEFDKTWREFYRKMRKSTLSPPTWVFGMTWFIMYALIGTAAFLCWQRDDGDDSKYQAALALYVSQIILASLWVPLFFGKRQLIAALILLVLVFGLSIATTVLFFMVRIVSGALFVVYPVWLVFALYLNGYAVYLGQGPDEDDFTAARPTAHHHNHTYAPPGAEAGPVAVDFV